MQLLEQALPPPQPLEEEKTRELTSSNSSAHSSPGDAHNNPGSTSSSLLSCLWLSVCSRLVPCRKDQSASRQNGSARKSKEGHSGGGAIGSGGGGGGSNPQQAHDPNDREDLEFCEQPNHSAGDFDDPADGDPSSPNPPTSNGVIKNVAVAVKTQKKAKAAANLATSANSTGSTCGTSALVNKDATIARLESEVKRMRTELQLSRNLEVELRSQISNLSAADKVSRSELNQLRLDNESLQSKLNKQLTCRQQDKQNLAMVERRLVEERKQKVTLENQLTTEKRRKAEESAALKASTPPPKSECSSENCKAKRTDLENELNQVKHDLKVREEKMRQLERENQSLQRYHSPAPDREVLQSALGALQEKNSQLERSLSAETRLKLDLFSALGDAKRQMEIHQGLLIQKDRELSDLKTRIAEVMAFMPGSTAYLGRTSSPLHLFSSPSPTLNYPLPQGLLDQPAKQQNSQQVVDGHSSPPPNSPYNQSPSSTVPPP